MANNEFWGKRNFSGDFLEKGLDEGLVNRLVPCETDMTKIEMKQNIKELFEHKMSITRVDRKKTLPPMFTSSEDYFRDKEEMEQFNLEYESLRDEMTRLNLSNHNLYSGRMSHLEQVFVYEDDYPLLGFRRNLVFIKRLWSHFCLKTIKHPLFEYISLIVIFINCVVMSYQNKYTEDNETLNNFEQAFLFLYLIEMLFKISGMGFVMSKKSYLRDYWNIIDFTIMVATIIVNILPEVDNFNFSGFRSLRVLRPLKTISSVKPLKVLLATLFSSLHLLFETLLILVFFIIIFSISGLQLFSGFLKNRCFEETTGRKHPQDILCGRDICPKGNICGKLLDNPQWGLISFDNLLSSMLQVFQCITMENWSSIMDQLRQAINDLVSIYFVVLVFICGFFLLNIVLAVIKSKFTEIQRETFRRKQTVSKTKTLENKLGQGDTIKDEEVDTESDKARKNAMQQKIISNQLKLLNEKFIYPLMQYVEIVKWRIEENSRFFRERETKFFMETNLKNKMRLFSKGELKKYDLKLSGELKNIMTYSVGMQRKSQIREIKKTAENRPKRNTIVDRNSLIGRLSRNNPILNAQHIYQGNELGSSFCFPRRGGDFKKTRKFSNTIVVAPKLEDKYPRKSRFSPAADSLLLEPENSVLVKRNNTLSSRSSFEMNEKSGNSPRKKRTTVFQMPENRPSFEKKIDGGSSPGYHSFVKETVEKMQQSQLQVTNTMANSMMAKKKGKKSFFNHFQKKSRDLNSRRNLINTYLKLDDMDVQHRNTVLKLIPPHFMTVFFDHKKAFSSSSFEEVLPLKKERELKEKLLQDEKTLLSKKLPFVYKLLEPPNLSENLNSAQEKALIRERGSASANRASKSKKISFNNLMISERRNFNNDPKNSFVDKNNGSFAGALISERRRFVAFDIKTTGKEDQKKPSFNNFLLSPDLEATSPRKRDEARSHRSQTEAKNKDSLLAPSMIPEPSPGRRRAITMKIPKYEELSRILNNRIDLEQIDKALKEDAEIDYFAIYTKIRKNDLETGKISSHHWSGKDVLENRKYPYYHFNHIFKTLMNINTNIWIPGYKGLNILLKQKLKRVIAHPLFDRVIFIAVIFNTFYLSLNGLVELSEDFDAAQWLVSFVFLIEMTLKLYVLGPFNYLRDRLNTIDGTVVVLSIGEMVLNGPSSSGGAISAFRAVRVFRVFRVLRLTKILRALSFMKVIIMVVSKCLQSIIYIALLLLLFIFVYALIGREIFGTKLGFQNDVRQNFDNSFNAILTIFQLMTLENWPDIFLVCLRSQVQPLITVLFIISWIFIGNYVLLNLFLAILLDSFTSEDVLVEMKKNEEDEDQIEAPKRRLTYIDTKALFASTIIEDTANDEFHKSLFLFSAENPFRRMCKKFIKTKFFENFVLLSITMSSVKLAIDTYITHSFLSDLIDYILNGIFIAEAVLKIISLGLILHPKSYLRESWNVLDFLIIVCSVIDMIFVNVDLPFLKVFRLVRLLRPLRFVSQNVNMRIVVTALLESLSSILNVSIVILFLWLMFAIFGVSLMRGRMGYCKKATDADPVFNIGKEKCEGELKRIWALRDTNFENIINGIITLFIVSSLESWPDIMFLTMDSNTEELGPSYNETWPMCYFFIVFIIVSSFFLMNLFTGAMFLHFNMARKKENFKGIASFITEEQMKWINMQKMIIKARPEFDMVKPPRQGTRLKIYKIINTSKFEYLILSCIIGSIIQMSIYYDDAPENIINILEKVNLIFSVIFILEAIVKIYALSFKGYWYSRWNRLDLVIMVASAVDLILPLLGSLVQYLQMGPQLARLFRVVRISRIFKLAKRFVGLQKLINTLTFSLPSMLNVGAILILVFFIYSVLGCFLFSEVKHGDFIGNNINFSQFDNALLALFRIVTGEGWQKIMFDLQRNSGCGDDFFCKSLPIIYFISFNVICTFIMMNFFVLIILQYFEDYNLKSDNPLESFQENLDSFRRVWTNYSYSYRGEKMNEKYLIDFFRALPPPLGMGTSVNLQTVAREIMFMNIMRDQDKCIYFNDLLFACLKRSYGEKMVNDNNTEVVRLLLREEMKTKNKIQLIKSKNYKKNLTDKKVHPYGYENKETIVNPFFTILFVRMTFKVWYSYYMEIERLKKSPNDHTPIQTFSRPVSMETESDYSEEENEYEKESDSDSEDSASSDSNNSLQKEGADLSGNEKTEQNQNRETLKDKAKIVVIDSEWVPEEGKIEEMQEEEDEGDKEIGFNPKVFPSDEVREKLL